MVFVPDATTTTNILADTPSVSIVINTFLQGAVGSDISAQIGVFRLVDFTIKISNLKISLATQTFQRVFDYVRELANNDINPVQNANSTGINLLSVGDVKTPSGGCTLEVNHTQALAVCTLTLVSTKLRLDYMDEFFERTTAYLSAALANDLNPEE